MFYIIFAVAEIENSKNRTEISNFKRRFSSRDMNVVVTKDDTKNGTTKMMMQLLFMNSRLPLLLLLPKNSVIVANNSDDYYSELEWIIVYASVMTHDGRDLVYEGAIWC